jgi:hypothetical protein
VGHGGSYLGAALWGRGSAAEAIPRWAAVRPVEDQAVVARVQVLVRDAIIAENRAREAVCRSSGLQMHGASGGLG